MLASYFVAIPVLVLIFIIQFGLAFKSYKISWYFSIMSHCCMGAVLVFVLYGAHRDTVRLYKVMADLEVPPGRPVMVNPSTKLLKVEAQGKTVLFSYEITSQENLPSFADAIEQNCNLALVRAVLELGGRIAHEYQQAQAKILAIEVDRDDCR